jgi:hypothetical protein
MKTYLAACAVAAAASLAIALGSEPRGAAALADAAVPSAGLHAPADSAWPAGLQAMARRPEHRWLLRAMSAGRDAGTLPTTPSDEPAPSTSL